MPKLETIVLENKKFEDLKAQIFWSHFVNYLQL
jgi:hypothetical protein